MRESEYNFTMQGGMKRLFHMVDERLSMPNALQELIDNSIDAKASDISITVSNQGIQFEYVDNGRGFDIQKAEEFARHFSVNDSEAFVRSNESIGYFGVGMKDTFIKVSDHSSRTGSTVHILTWASPEDGITEIEIKVFDNDEYAFLEPKCNILSEKSAKFKELVSKYGDHATIIRINRIKKELISENGDSLNIIRGLIEQASNAYTFKNSITPLNIKYNVIVNGETKISEKLPIGEDKMHLKSLLTFDENGTIIGNKINEPGVYQIGDDIFVIKKYTLAFGDKRRVVTVVYLYSDNDLLKSNAMFAIYKGRYVTWPQDADRKMPFDIINRGGQGKMRFVVFVDGNEDILQLCSNKSSGINLSDDNANLKKYRVVGETGGLSKPGEWKNILKRDFYRLYDVQLFKTKNQKSLLNHRNGEREVTVDTVKRFLKGEGIGSIIKEYDMKNGIISNNKPVGKITTLASDTITKSDDKELVREAEAAMTVIEEKKAPIVIFTKGKGEKPYIINKEAIPPFANEQVLGLMVSVLYKHGGITKKMINELALEFANELEATNSFAE